MGLPGIARSILVERYWTILKRNVRTRFLPELDHGKLKTDIMKDSQFSTFTCQLSGLERAPVSRRPSRWVAVT